jgi:threonine dehydratase
VGSIADAIMVTRVGEAPFPLLQRLVDEIAVVDEGQIASAVLILLECKCILAEGVGAVPLAVLLGGSLNIPEGSKVVLVIDTILLAHF